MQACGQQGRSVSAFSQRATSGLRVRPFTSHKWRSIKSRAFPRAEPQTQDASLAVASQAQCLTSKANALAPLLVSFYNLFSSTKMRAIQAAASLATDRCVLCVSIIGCACPADDKVCCETRAGPYTEPWQHGISCCDCSARVISCCRPSTSSCYGGYRCLVSILYPRYAAGDDCKTLVSNP